MFPLAVHPLPSHALLAQFNPAVANHFAIPARMVMPRPLLDSSLALDAHLEPTPMHPPATSTVLNVQPAHMRHLHSLPVVLTLLQAFLPHRLAHSVNRLARSVITATRRDRCLAPRAPLEPIKALRACRFVTPALVATSRRARQVPGVQLALLVCTRRLQLAPSELLVAPLALLEIFPPQEDRQAALRALSVNTMTEPAESRAPLVMRVCIRVRSAHRFVRLALRVSIKTLQAQPIASLAQRARSPVSLVPRCARPALQVRFRIPLGRKAARRAVQALSHSSSVESVLSTALSVPSERSPQPPARRFATTAPLVSMERHWALSSASHVLLASSQAYQASPRVSIAQLVPFLRPLLRRRVQLAMLALSLHSTAVHRALPVPSAKPNRAHVLLTVPLVDLEPSPLRVDSLCASSALPANIQTRTMRPIALRALPALTSPALACPHVSLAVKATTLQLLVQ